MSHIAGYWKSAMSPPEITQSIYVLFMIYANSVTMDAHNGAYVRASFFTYTANIHHTVGRSWSPTSALSNYSQRSFSAEQEPESVAESQSSYHANSEACSLTK
jgi:hypothetical protein